jgi:hypothetical protein
MTVWPHLSDSGRAHPARRHRRRDRFDHEWQPTVGKLAIEMVAKRKPASAVSGEQSDRQLSAGISRPTGS